jgi:hypothetical protein
MLCPFAHGSREDLDNLKYTLKCFVKETEKVILGCFARKEDAISPFDL